MFLQVFCSLLFIITIVAVLANFGPIVRSIFHSVRQHYERLQAAKIAAGLPAGSELVQKLGQDKADSVASTILSTIAICLGSTLGLAVPSKCLQRAKPLQILSGMSHGRLPWCLTLLRSAASKLLHCKVHA